MWMEATDGGSSTIEVHGRQNWRKETSLGRFHAVRPAWGKESQPAQFGLVIFLLTTK